MKNAIRILLAVTMSITFVNCGDDDGGGGGNKSKAKAPDRNGCLYDTRLREYRDRDGRSCDYDRFYDEDACYNYYFNAHTSWTRTDSHYNRPGYRNYDGYFTNKRGAVVNCELVYIGEANYFPYYRFDPARGYIAGCDGWEFGGYNLDAVPLGGNGYVCVYNSTYAYPIYQSPGWNTYYNYGYHGSPGWYYHDDRDFGDFLEDTARVTAAGLLVWGAYNIFK